MHLIDLLFEDNPWWVNRFEGKGWFPEIKGKGILKVWIPPGRVDRNGIMWFCQKWADVYGKFSAFFFDLERFEVLPDMLYDALNFYYTRMSFISEKRLIVINSAHILNDHKGIEEFAEDETTILMIYPVFTENANLRILRFKRESFKDLEKRFWEGDFEGFLRGIRDKGISKRLEMVFWRDVMGFPNLHTHIESIYRALHIINEFYDIREKGFLRRFLNFVVENHGQPFVYRDLADSLDVRFETIKSFMDYFFSVGLSFEVSEIGSSPRAHRRIFLSSGRFYNALTHMDFKSLFALGGDELLLKYSFPELFLAANERGFQVSLKDESGKSFVITGDNKTFGIKLSDFPYYFVSAV